jgi:hypothetical protein
MQDLIERLRDADPLPDGEQLTPAEQREADGLLARLVAEPIATSARSRRAPTRRWALAGGVALGLALALGLVSLLDDDEGAPGVAARAAAAVSDPKAIYHTVSIARVTVPDAENPHPRPAWFEAWDAPDGSTHQKVFRVDDGRRGKLRGEMAGRLHPKGRGRFGGPLVTYDARENTIMHMRFGRSPGRGAPTLTPGADPGRSLKALQAEGRLRLAGSTRVGDRDAYRLVSGPVPGFAKGRIDRSVYLVDSETYYPLLVRYEYGNASVTIRYLVYERLPFDAWHRELLKLDPHPGAKEYDRDGKLVKP